MSTKSPHQSHKGFTIIELLVVISIVSMLSSIVLASLKGARDKADNSYTIQTIRQYINAFELIKSTTGYYPTINPLNPQGWVCLGKPPNGIYCLYNDILPDVSFDTLLRQYYPGLPSPNPKVIIHPNIQSTYGGPNMSGSVYAHTCPACAARIVFLLKGNNQSCIFPGASSNPNFGEGTYCDLSIPQ